MTCPHCNRTVKYRQRTKCTCDLCKKEFAFEPKDHPIALHDLRFRKTIDHLGQGGLKFTAGQLRFALIRKAQAPAGIKSSVLLFFPLLGVALFVIFYLADMPEKGVAAGLGVMGALAILKVINSSATPPWMSEVSFRGQVLDRWKAVYREAPKGLVDEAVTPTAPDSEQPQTNLAAVLVCPEHEVMTCLLANRVPRELRLGLLSSAPPFTPRETALLELLRSKPQLPILLLHDASAEGVLLARDLPQILGLKPGHRIFDLGLHPKKSMAKGRFVFEIGVPAELSARLARESLGADVAGSRAIRRGRAQVSPTELTWLQKGKCSPILALSPDSLIKRLKFALNKLASKRSAATTVSESREAVGFLTWPA